MRSYLKSLPRNLNLSSSSIVRGPLAGTSLESRVRDGSKVEYCVLLWGSQRSLSCFEVKNLAAKALHFVGLALIVMDQRSQEMTEFRTSWLVCTRAVIIVRSSAYAFLRLFKESGLSIAHPRLSWHLIKSSRRLNVMSKRMVDIVQP